MPVILINGAPGSDKTDVALELGRLMHIDQFISTRAFADFLNLGPPNTDNPYELNQFIQSAAEFEKPFLSMIEKIDRKGFSAIVEGVHVTPATFEKMKVSKKYGFYLTPNSLDEQIMVLKNRYEERKISHLLKERLPSIRILDDYLRKECEKVPAFKVIRCSTSSKTVENIIASMF